MDQSVIHTPGLRIRKDVMERKPEIVSALEGVGRCQITTNREGEQAWAVVKVGPQIAAQLSVRKVGASWECKKISLFVPRWLWGHNGRVVDSHELLLAAFQRYYRVCSELVEPEFRHLLLPGLGHENPSYWHSIEIPIHVADPGGRLLRGFEAVSHPSIANTPLVKSGESVDLKGVNLQIKAYDKCKQLGGQSPSSEPILRLEVKLSRQYVAGYLDDSCRKAPKSKWPKEWAHGFSYETLYHAARRCLCETEGVFASGRSRADGGFIPALMAGVSDVTSITPGMWEVLLEGVFCRGGNTGKKTVRKHLKEYRSIAANRALLRLEAYVPETPPPYQPSVITRSEKAGEKAQKVSLGPVSEAIRATYHDSRSTDTPFWRPSMDCLMPWCID